ncbi:hypothetical protein CB1_001212002 [Camelus ferus]|nr:hypothetical protein CB1_001212002 [Camelus ferus]
MGAAAPAVPQGRSLQHDSGLELLRFSVGKRWEKLEGSGTTSPVRLCAWPLRFLCAAGGGGFCGLIHTRIPSCSARFRSGGGISTWGVLLPSPQQHISDKSEDGKLSEWV